MKNKAERTAVKEKLDNGIKRLKLCESRLASSPELAAKVVHLDEYVMAVIPD
jgi:hypothetical protein